MKEYFTKVFAMIVAIIAIVVGIIELTNAIHMLGVSSDASGFTVTWTEDPSWEFIPSMRIVEEWIIFILAVIYVIFGWEKKSTSKDE